MPGYVILSNGRILPLLIKQISILLSTDWLTKPIPYEVERNKKPDILTPENFEDNGKPSTIFKSFDMVDLYEFKNQSDFYDYQKVENSDEVYKNYDNPHVYNPFEAMQCTNHTTFKAFNLPDLMSEFRRDFRFNNHQGLQN